MSHRAFVTVALSTALIATLLGSAPAAEAADGAQCVSRAQNNRTFEAVDGTTRSIAYSGADAKIFIGGLSMFVGTLPASIDAAAAVSTYVASLGNAGTATIRFYGSDGCDVGVNTELSAGILRFIVSTIGTHI
jgi:hypothetical protein